MASFDRLTAANQLLAPYAIPHQGRLGRPVPEPPDETRTPFQRDRDRIIHADAFRRLQGKTQVFLAGEGDHFRTRLTHTMEVAQIGRDIARTLRLNEDVTEAIALAHDLGHPPFGHRGEEAIDRWMKTRGGSFEHNEQSLRIVSLLETHASGIPGLNLNREILEGLQKHAPGGRVGERSHSLEAQVVNIADEIAYCAHDADDGLRAGIFSKAETRTVSLAREAARRTEERGTTLRGSLIHLLVTDLYAETGKRLSSVKSIEDVDRAAGPLVSFSESMKGQLREWRAFLWDHMYSHPRVTDASATGQKILMDLCEQLFNGPPRKVLDLQKRTGDSLAVSVKDYVAGMTDAFAIDMNQHSRS